jgi:transposase
MRRTEQLQGLRMLRMRDVLSHWQEGTLSQLEAAEVLGMSERTFRRYVQRFESDGEDGLRDRRLGRRSGRAVPEEEAFAVERLYRERYEGFTAKHFHEHLRRNHGFRWGYTWTKTFLQDCGLIAKAKIRGAHRRKRPRRPLVGMMLHQSLPRRRPGMPRRMSGSRAWVRSISPSPWTMPRARFTRRSWSRRKAPCRASRG